MRCLSPAKRKIVKRDSADTHEFDIYAKTEQLKFIIAVTEKSQ